MLTRMLVRCALAFSPVCLCAGCTQHTDADVGQPTAKPSADAPPQVGESDDRPGVGVLEDYWPDGTLRLRKHVVITPDGTEILHGPLVRWHSNGQTEYEGTFAHGKKEGVAIRYHKNGRKWLEEHYLDGQRHGVARQRRRVARDVDDGVGAHGDQAA